MNVKRVATIVADGIGAVGGIGKAPVLPHLHIVASHDDLIRGVDHVHLAIGLRQPKIAVIEDGIRPHQLGLVMHKGSFVEIYMVFVHKIIAMLPFQHIFLVDDGCRSLKPHLFDVGVVKQGVGIHLIFRTIYLHILKKRELFQTVAVIAVMTFQGFVATYRGSAVGITGQMQVAVVGQIFGVECGGVVTQPYVVVKLGETHVAIIVQQVAEDLHAVVDDDMDVLIRVEAIGSLVKIGAVAKEISGVVTHLHVTDEFLHLALTLRESGLVVMLNVDTGLLALHSILPLCHKHL